METIRNQTERINVNTFHINTWHNINVADTLRHKHASFNAQRPQMHRHLFLRASGFVYRYRSTLAFERCTRISAATPLIPTVDSRVLPQSFHTTDVKVPQSGHDRIHPDPLQFINRCIILSYVVDTETA
jgi:hypothetical protein